MTGEQKENRRLMLWGEEFFYVCITGIVFAFLGWCVENITRIVDSGVIDSRFHLMPFISPYGLIPFAFLAFNSPDDLSLFGHRFFKEKTKRNRIRSNIACFLLICALVFFGELIVGYIWGEVFGYSLWNYSNIPLHITPYTGVLTTLAFGTGVYLLFRYVYRPLMGLVKKIPYKTAKIISLIVWPLMILDTVAMGVQIVLLGEARLWWEIKLF